MQSDQPWIALTRCDDDTAVWGVCSQDGNPSTLQNGVFCSCTEVAQFKPTAFSDASVLALFASLPTATGESIKFETGHVPTGNPTSDSSPAETGSPSAGATGTSGGSNASRTSGGNPSGTQDGTTSGNNGGPSQTGPTGSNSSSNSGGNGTGNGNGGGNGSNGSTSGNDSSGLASGAKIGIGVGAAVAVLLLIAIIAAILLRRRKRRRTQAAAAATEVEKGDSKDTHAVAAAGRTSDITGTDPRISDVTAGTEKTNVLEADGKPLSGADKPGVTELDSRAVMELPGQTAHPYDRGAELDGRQIKPASPKPVAELPGSLAAESPPGWVIR